MGKCSPMLNNVFDVTLALPHACQLLIKRGTQKTVACHDLAYPLEAVSKV